MGLFNRLCMAMAGIVGLLLFAYGLVGVFQGLVLRVELPPGVAGLVALVGWGILQAILQAWRRKPAGRQAVDRPRDLPSVIPSDDLRGRAEAGHLAVQAGMSVDAALAAAGEWDGCWWGTGPDQLTIERDDPPGPWGLERKGGRISMLKTYLERGELLAAVGDLRAAFEGVPAVEVGYDDRPRHEGATFTIRLDARLQVTGKSAIVYGGG